MDRERLRELAQGDFFGDRYRVIIGESGVLEGWKLPMNVEQQLTFLQMAARVDPLLRQAVIDVEWKLRDALEGIAEAKELLLRVAWQHGSEEGDYCWCSQPEEEGTGEIMHWDQCREVQAFLRRGQ